MIQFKNQLSLAALIAAGTLGTVANAAVIAVVDANNILPTAVTTPNDASWGQYNRDLDYMYDQAIDNSTDATNVNVMIPTSTTTFELDLDAAYNLTELRAYTGGFDRYATSVKFETSTDGGSSWTDRGTVSSGSFTADSTYSTGFDVASVTGSFSNVNAIQFTIVSAGLNARVGEVMALVPEPGSLALLGLGGLLIGSRRRRG